MVSEGLMGIPGVISVGHMSITGGLKRFQGVFRKLSMIFSGIQGRYCELQGEL